MEKWRVRVCIHLMSTPKQTINKCVCVSLFFTCAGTLCSWEWRTDGVSRFVVQVRQHSLPEAEESGGKGKKKPKKGKSAEEVVHPAVQPAAPFCALPPLPITTLPGYTLPDMIVKLVYTDAEKQAIVQQDRVNRPCYVGTSGNRSVRMCGCVCMGVCVCVYGCVYVRCRQQSARKWKQK